MKRDTSLNQFFTPTWAAELIVQHFYPDLSERDTVLEAGCGDGRFLMAVPEDVDAYGVEIDPTLIDEARHNTGREIIQGDFREVDLPRRPTVVLGNPPYEMRLIEQFLARCYEEMDYGGRVGWLLPCYIYQTASTVMSFAEKWSLDQTLIPRNIFQGFEKPLLWASFVKERRTVMAGFFLYEETHAITQLDRRYKTIFVGNESRANVWAEAIELALINLGGQAHLQEIYREIEGKRPTNNPWWKEKLRQQARKHFRALGDGRYSLNIAPKYEQLALAV